MVGHYTLNLIRHLPTLGNQQKRYIGWSDEPIVEQIHSQVAQKSVPLLYGSDLLRARQTAALLFRNATYHPDARWRECNFGAFEGKTYNDLEEDSRYRNWIDEPYQLAPPGGEQLKEVERRVLTALAELPNGATVITHGGPIRLVLSKFSSETKEFWSWDVSHGGMYRLEWLSEQAFKEGKSCISISAVPITASEPS